MMLTKKYLGFNIDFKELSDTALKEIVITLFSIQTQAYFLRSLGKLTFLVFYIADFIVYFYSIQLALIIFKI
jgi:hypothetical protein